jgi:hypothetical protein
MKTELENMLVKVGDLVVAHNYLGVFRIEGLSDDGATADIQLYEFAASATTGKRISVSVSILRPFK